VRLLTTAAVQALEAHALTRSGPGVLMQRAGLALALQAQRMLRTLPSTAEVLVMVGPGNNGADALLAGLHLQAQGYRVLAVEALAPNEQASEAAKIRQQAHREGLLWISPERAEAILTGAACHDGHPGGAWLVLDGLFGIGLKRPIEGRAQKLIEASNARDTRTTRVLSVDLPSGLNADTGQAVGPTVVRADVTLTLLADKPGLHTGEGGRWSGQVLLDPLGVSDEDITLPGGELYDLNQARADRSIRGSSQHKGDFGDLLVIQGRPATQGAAVLALLGAQAAGAGRLFLGRDTLGAADSTHPEFMARTLAPGPLADDALGPADALVIGCGLGQDERARQRLAQALAHEAALVLDADALNLIAVHDALRASLSMRGACGTGTTSRACVLTPHPLEAARLLGSSTQQVQAHRIEAATRLARTLGSVIVLKGWGTVVADPAGRWSINASGGPLLAVAGTGDVLAGVIGGLLAQGKEAWAAARLGVWLHGAAADSLSQQAGWSAGIGLAASTLAPAIRDRINQLGEGRFQ
jgi:hydroxyethylthiazole kinase-like uncharacterized protein yjeF